MNRNKALIMLAITALALTACAAAVTPTPTPTVTPAPTRTPMPTITPTPVTELYAEGPWFVYLGSDVTGEEYLQHLLIVNWDGTALTQLIPDLYAWQVEVQPASDGKSGQYAAVVVSNENNDLNYRLLILHLPEGEIVEDIPLTPPVPTRDVSFLLTNWDTLSWSPDGQKLAFSGIAEGERLDVFVYSLEDGDITRLTYQQHASNAASMKWSPDGRYIAYESSMIAVEALIAGPDSIWVTRDDGSGTWMLTSDEEWESEWCPGVYIDQWISDIELAMNCPIFGEKRIRLLKVFNIESGYLRSISPDNDPIYWGAVYAPEIETWLMGFDEHIGSDRANSMFFYRDGEWQLAGPADSPFMTWWPERGVFITSRGLLSPDGDLEEMDLPPFDALFSPDNSYWSFPVPLELRSAFLTCYYWSKRLDYFWIGKAGEVPTLIEMPLQVLEWSANSQSVLLQDRELTGQYIAVAPDFEPQLISTFTGVMYGPSEREYPPEP